nr:MAG TPA: hypothetical protein [Caudoviricetes sp.]
MTALQALCGTLPKQTMPNTVPIPTEAGENRLPSIKRMPMRQ